MSIDSKIQSKYKKLSQEYSDKPTEIPLSEIEELLNLVEKSLEELEALFEQEDSGEENSEDSSEENSEDSSEDNSATIGKWAKKRFNRIQKKTAEVQNEEESENATISFPSIQSGGNKETILAQVFDLLREYWVSKIDPVLEGLSVLQGEPVSKSKDENKPIPISVLALETEHQSMIKFVDLYVDWASQGTDEDVQEESILWRVACYMHFLGHSNLDTLHALLQLGMMYRENNEFVLAEQVLGNTLHRLSESQGEDALPTLQAALQLTLLYNKAGQYEDALEIGEDLVEALEDNFGPEAGETLLGVLACADALVGLGEFENAAEILEELLPAMEPVFGALHEETLKAELLWVTILIETEAIEEAMEIMQERVDRIASEYGIISLESIEALEEWAGLTVDAEDLETAHEMYTQALAWRTELMNQNLQNGNFAGEEEFAQSILSPALLQLANISMENGEYKEALEVFEKVLRLEEKIDLDDAKEELGDEFDASEIQDSVDTALTRKMFADCLAAIGRTREARSEYNRSLQVLLQHRGEDIDEVLDIQDALDALPEGPEFSVIDGDKPEFKPTEILKGRFPKQDDE